VSGPQILAVLGHGVVPPTSPLMRADDAGILGDGLFETMHVRGGQPWLLDEHLLRMARSADVLDLVLPPAGELADLIAQVCAAWPTDDEGALRVVCTRGPEGAGTPTAFATLSAVPALALRGRRLGITVATLPLAVAAGARTGAPWLLTGVKSTSYGVSLAARRWAAAQGIDDVLWTSTDGYALEGPTASLVWLEGGTLFTVPAAAAGTLPGVTVGWLLAHAGELGWSADERMVTPAELRETIDGVWFASSVRGLAEVRSLDGMGLPRSPHTAAMHDLLGFSTA
jgi:4-amino-4-deoxychorismate lyase